MNEPLLNINEIEKYVHGYMTEQEKIHFEEELKRNLVLQQEYTLYKQLIEGVKYFHKDRLKQSLRDFDKQMPAPVSAKVFSLRQPFVWMAAACTSLALAAGLYLYKSGDNTFQANVISNYVVDDPGLPVLMSNQYQEKQAEAMNYYHTGNYQKALDTWSKIPAGELGEDTIHYYKGIFLMKLAEYDSANSYLSALVHTNSSFSERASYYLALSFWQQQKIEKAKETLLEIQADTTHTYYDLASKILEEDVFQ